MVVKPEAPSTATIVRTGRSLPPASSSTVVPSRTDAQNKLGSSTPPAPTFKHNGATVDPDLEQEVTLEASVQEATARWKFEGAQTSREGLKEIMG